LAGAAFCGRFPRKSASGTQLVQEIMVLATKQAEA
jgi:hypothetical protein